MILKIQLQENKLDSSIISIFPGESHIEYMRRICDAKKQNKLTWAEVTSIINNELGYTYSESWYRKSYQAGDFSCESDVDDEYQKFIRLQEERIKLSDERAQVRADRRRITREKTLVDIAKIALESLEARRLLPQHTITYDEGVNKAILQLSDWHYGLIINNAWNSFSPEIAKERLMTLLTKVIHKCKSHNVSELYVVNLGDLISGRIHETIRIQNRIDVVTQVLEVSEILAEFLAKIVESKIRVKYISCSDNHSRVEPKKESSLDLESLTRIIDKILQLSLGKEVEFLNSPYGDDIATFKVMNYDVVAVHGHKDTPKNIVPNMTLMTRKAYDLALTAHLHHFSADETNETVIVSNGSLMGVDDYAQQLRLTSKPSQNLIICSENSVVDSIHRITLD